MTTAGPCGWRLDTHDRLASTQDEARRLAAGGARHVAVRADRQTAGRGRADRRWDDGGGNLVLSAILPARDVPVGHWPLASGVALHSAIASTAPRGRLLLRWPNDLLLDGAKLAGILIECADDVVVIGIGINIATRPALPDRATTSLASHVATPPTPAALAATLLPELDRWSAAPFAGVRAAWASRAHPPGTALSVRNGTSTRSGRFLGLDADGRLLLDDGLAPVLAGEIAA